jgi:uncharacterized protein (TIGR03437 family)
LQQTPASGTIPANSSVQMQVQANLAGLGTGLWYGTLRVAFGDGTIQSIQVLLSVTGGSSNSGAVSERISPHATGSCAPGQQLLLLFQSPSNPFSVAAQAPGGVPVNVLATQCDGITPFNGGGPGDEEVAIQIGSSTSTSLVLSPPLQQDGVWTATWNPPVPASGVTLNAVFIEYTGGTSSAINGSTSVTGNVTAPGADAPPAVSAVQNGADYLGTVQITPGAWATLRGAGLASGPAVQQNIPYTNSLLTTQVTMQGQSLPLYYVSPNQVNALIPQGVNQGNQQLTVTRDGNNKSVGINVQVINPQPGIFSVDSSGTGQGSIQIANTGYIAGPTSTNPPQKPVARGQFISIYCNGLGPVNGTPPLNGSPAANSPLLSTTATPVVTIGGIQAPPPSFSGLAPGLVGLYQVNVQVPTSVTSGDSVPVSLTIGGVTSNTVTIAVQ